MSNTSNFRKAISDAQNSALVGPNVIANALPYVGGGLILTAVGTFGGINVLQTRPDIFMPTFFVAIDGRKLRSSLFAQNVARKGNNCSRAAATSNLWIC